MVDTYWANWRKPNLYQITDMILCYAGNHISIHKSIYFFADERYECRNLFTP